MKKSLFVIVLFVLWISAASAQIPPGGGGSGGSGTVTSITAVAPLSGGVITTSGSIGIDVPALTATTTPASTDILYIVVDPPGTPLSRKVTVGNLVKVSLLQGLGTGVGTFLATPSGANLLAALTTKTGTGLPVFDTSPTISGATLTGATSFTNGQFAITGGTVTTSAPVLDITQTWNGAGVIFTGLKFNVTDTASSLSSRLFDMQVGGVTKAYFDKTGQLSLSNDGVVLSGGGNTFGITAGGVNAAEFQNSLFRLNYATPSIRFNNDLILIKEAAAIMQLGLDVNGAAIPQTLKSHDGITGTDVSGANFILASGRGTGAGPVSQVLIATPTVGSTGTTGQTNTTRVTIDSSGIKATGYLSSDGTAGVTVTTCTGFKNGLCISGT